MKQLSQPDYHSEFATTPEQFASVHALRKRCFGDAVLDLDVDEFDSRCQHVLITDARTQAPLCCYRFMLLESARKLDQSYSSQFYDLSNLTHMSGALLELGRFCVDPDLNDPNILRMAWSILTQFVDKNRVEFLFGCSSFHGIDQTPYTHAFALLKEQYLAPKTHAPQIKAAEIFAYADALRQLKPDIKRANQTLPPLLRTYLTMGGWVSDHAVIDTGLNTLHVFTGLDINAIPESRKRLLRALG